MIIVFGSTNLDQIGRVDHLPRRGETVGGSEFSISAGGKGANQALAARRAGGVVRHVSAVGNDAFAEPALKELRAAGVDLGALTVSDRHTGIAMILVDSNGDNTIAVLPGANGALGAEQAYTTVDAMDEDDVLLVQQEIPQPATEAALRRARERGLTSIINTAPMFPTTRDVAVLASVLVANEGEFAGLSGCSPADIEPAMRQWAMEHGQTVIVTLGPDGVIGAQGEAIYRVPALPITPLDTVGAGDTFCGYLAEGLSRRYPLDQAMRRAAVAASLACLKPGAQPAIPHLAEVEEALAVQ